MSGAEDLDHWRLADELSVVQAALLILGRDPGDAAEDAASLPGYAATVSALANAVLSRALPATIRRSAWTRGWDEEPGEGEQLTKKVELVPWDADAPDAGEARATLRTRGVIYRAAPDWSLTTVRVEALREWLVSRGAEPAFFFPPQPETALVEADYLDPANPRYAPKLAAAVMAWQAVGDPTGVHPKQALATWLNEHAVEFGLSRQGIEECSAVANWRAGGPGKTPGS